MHSPPLSTRRTHAYVEPAPAPTSSRDACTRHSSGVQSDWRPSESKRQALKNSSSSSGGSSSGSTAIVAAAPTDLKPASEALTATPAPIALSRTPKFKPWLKKLEGELLDMALKVIQETTGQRVESGAEDMDDDEIATEQEMQIRREREVGASAYQGEHMENLRRLGGGVGKLVQLIHQDLLPRMPSDPEALFLAASADFITRKFASALPLMQTALMAVPEGHLSSADHGARHYFCALIAIRLITEADVAEKGEDATGKMKLDEQKMPPERKAELCGIVERGLTEALRLDPRLHSAYIDAEMLAQIRYPEDAHARVAMHASLVESACKTRKFWVDKLQRPMHFYPKLRSQPWWDASDFPWALKLMTHYQVGGRREQ